VGDNAVAYAPVGDVDAWTAAVLTLLDERDARDGRWQARRDAGLTRAARFTWQRNAQQMRELYEHVVWRRAS
jgi:glycosyltransferase involved in cell wall biosynthesis